ncbi:hypothetical protein MY10362_006565 [Beauveria mimosiformis]
MVTALYLQAIYSKSAFDSRYKTEKAQSFTQLRHPSASSKWGRREFFACRVLPSVRETLPLLRDFVVEPDQFSPEIRRFIEGPELNHLAWSELALIWGALATFRGPPDRRPGTEPAVVGSGQDEDRGDDDDQESSGRGKRIRRNTQQEGFRDSSTMQVESSSPVSASNRSSSIGYIDPDSQAPWQPEDDTLHFIRCALRHVLYFAPAHTDADIVIEVRDAKLRLSAATLLENRPLVAVDDGGLCLRQHIQGGAFQTRENRVMNAGGQERIAMHPERAADRVR